MRIDFGEKGYVEVKALDVMELSEMAEIYGDFIEEKEVNALKAISKLLKRIVPFLKDKVKDIRVEDAKKYDAFCKLPGSFEYFTKIMTELMGGISLGKSSDEN